jgi:transcriptional regulator with XRE-family HTH domain
MPHRIIIKPQLHALLRRKNMTQHELSRRTGIPQGTISRFDRNLRHDSRHLILISRTLNVSIDDLFIVEESDEKITLPAE